MVCMWVSGVHTSSCVGCRLCAIPGLAAEHLQPAFAPTASAAAVACCREQVAEKGEAAVPSVMIIITDAGSASKEQGNFIIKEAIATMMSFWGAPFRPVQDKTFLGVIEAAGPQVTKWVQSDSFAAQMASLFPIAVATQVKCNSCWTLLYVICVVACRHAHGCTRDCILMVVLYMSLSMYDLL